ncbi:hypothetical protein BDM02DRAFT_992243 [Thelephora ganbajun]|uniref:Uncharacterized protein n=1 Tax=Thelephora ganbajun TaxID=370292 RepID=A0ACB6Z432_THEGA|nr:hypothetical protein BDM02DRAFT_992243 [Thelephora ganbajun]
MVMTEAFTGMVPFHGKLAVAATFDILSGIRPPRPKDPTVAETLWTLVQSCWAQDPHSRPDISEALQVLLTPDIQKSWNNADGQLDTTTTNVSSPSITHVTTPNPGTLPRPTPQAHL